MAPTIVNLHPFDVMAEGSYPAAVAHLRGALANSAAGDVEGRPILAVQTGVSHQPARWIHVQVHAPGGASPTLAIRDDNAYLVGFSNKHGHWYELGKRGDPMLLPHATPLGFNGSYHSLVGGSNNLPGLNLGKNNLVEAAKKLWNYNHRAPEDDGADQVPENAGMTINGALGRLVVALCEGARFPQVLEAVNAAWEGGASITDHQVTLINNWENISSALLGTKLYGDTFVWPRNLINIGIAGKTEALPLIYLLLNKPPRPRMVFFLNYLKNNLWHKCW